MSSWAYCQKCGAGLHKPTPHEVIEDSYYCAHCGAKEDDPRMTKDELILELFDRVEQLEKMRENT